jgi:hypothetical protein
MIDATGQNTSCLHEVISFVTFFKTVGSKKNHFSFNAFHQVKSSAHCFIVSQICFSSSFNNSFFASG